MKQSSSHRADYYRYVEDVLSPEDVHDAQRVSVATATNGLFVLLSLALVAVHGFILYLFIGSEMWPIIPLSLHVGVSLIVALVAYAQYRRGMDVQHLSLLAIVSATTGVFGAAGALLGFLFTVILRPRSYHFNEWYETIFPTDQTSESQSIYDRITEGLDENPRNYSVMPFLDVMRLGSENQKRRALAKMTSRFNPHFAPAFKAALNDSHNAIRVQAATAIAKIEREFSVVLERIELARAMRPNDAHITLALAKFYDDYAFTGVLDKELERANRERAITAYRDYLKHDPNAMEVWMAVGRLLYRNQQWKEAADWFRSALDRNMKSPRIILWYFESLFYLHQHRELRRAILEYGRTVTTQDDLPGNVRDAVGFWMQVA